MASRSEPDRAQLHRLRDRDVDPIFIMGLHRSGTTWLYDALSSCALTAWLSVYDVVHYGELLPADLAGRTALLRDALDRRFREQHARVRGFDEVPLNHATREEYGFVLRHWAGTSILEPKSLGRFEELARKLSVLQGPRTVLLKNPWDTRQAGWIAQALPKARFVWIKRDPVRILDSQVRMYLGFARQGNPLLSMLQEGLKLERGLNAVAGGLTRALGDRASERLLERVVEKLVVQELQHYATQRRRVPAERQIEITYEELVERPAKTLTAVLGFLGLSPSRPLEAVNAKPREHALLPSVEVRASAFRAKVA